MPHNRFYVKDLNDSKLLIEDAEFHHLKHVMRLKENEEIELIDGQGHLAQAMIEKLERSHAKVSILSKNFEPKKPIKTVLAVACPKFSHLEFAVEKATEIGIDQLIFFPSERSEKIAWTDSQKERLSNLLIAAIKQCGRLWLPEVVFFDKIDDLKKIEAQKFHCHLSNPTKKIDSTTFQGNPSCLIVGPEKGWSEKDLAFLENILKSQAVTLGHNILRMETACVVSATLLCHFLDQLSDKPRS